MNNDLSLDELDYLIQQMKKVDGWSIARGEQVDFPSVHHANIIRKLEYLRIKLTMWGSMKPEEIQLQSTSRQFEYEKISRELEDCDDPTILKEMLRAQIKLYMKLQETVAVTFSMKWKT